MRALQLREPQADRAGTAGEQQMAELVIRQAEERDIALLSTGYRMFTACGLLYSNGLRGGCEDE